MKKLFLFLAAIAVAGCSSDDSSSNAGGSSFDLDGTEFQLHEGMGMSEIVMSGWVTFNDEAYDRSTITVTGLNGTSSSASVSFDLYHKEGTSVAGTYTIYDAEADDAVGTEEFFAGKERGCMGWTSAGVIFPLNGGTTSTSGNNPTGTVKVIVNSATNYTLQYSGNFRVYDNDFNVERTMPASINVTSDVVIQD